MKILPLSVLAAGAAVLAACATNPPVVYGPGPDGAVSVSTVQEGMIAECRHPGAEPAQIVYPAGWQVRLSETAQKSISNDELLGGPVTTEVVDRNAKPVSPPVPVYPAGPAGRGREAACYAMMDVNTAGMPEEILTACSSPEFNAATLNAVSKLSFTPKIVEGRAVRRLNVVYPVVYCLAG